MKLEGAGQAERANAAQRTEALQRAQEHIDGLEERLFDLEGKVGGRGVAGKRADLTRIQLGMSEASTQNCHSVLAIYVAGIQLAFG